MAKFIRKSFSMGPVRFNLSKSGIGMSAGVKGLRIGMDSKGKSYISGGRHGLYFKESLGKKSNITTTNEKSYNTGKSEHQLTSEDKYSQINKINIADIGSFDISSDKSRKYIIISLAIILAVLDLFIQTGYISLLAMFTFLSAFIYHKYRTKKVLGFVDKLTQMAKEKKTKDFIELSNKLMERLKKDKIYITYIFAEVYSNVIPTIIEDFIIDEDEKRIIETIKKGLSEEIITNLNTLYLQILVMTFTEDNLLDKNEEKFINEYKSVFHIDPIIKTEIDLILKDYIRLRELGEKPLELTSPSFDNIKESDMCYYETEFKQLKNKTVKSYTEQGVRNKIMQYVADKSGTLLVTKNLIHLVSEGHTTIKMDKLLNISLLKEEDGIIEIVLEGRKTPIYLSTPHTVETFVIINKALSERSN